MKQKVPILTTGGTISQRSNADGVAVMNFEPKLLASELALASIDIVFEKVIQKGSKDIVPDDWKLIATATAKAINEGCAGVVILHGTDTMHYTAAALSFMLQGLSVPVVLTGSMIPGGDVGSDSLPNLRDAVRVAARSDLAEVCIVFSVDQARSKGVIIRGTRARKIHSLSIDAFGSINVPPIGHIEGEAITLGELKAKRRSSAQLVVTTELDQNVVFHKLTPADTPERLARNLQGANGAILEGTGVGHIRSDLLDTIARFKKPTVITTQTVYGGEHLGIYESDKTILDIPNIIPAGDMSSETALVKLMWALKQGDVRSIMRTNIAGEIA